MTRSRVMLAAASPGGIPPVDLGKVAKLAAGLDAELELFHCIYDRDVARPGRFGTRGARQDIRTFVELRRQQLEVTAGALRARGLRVRTSVRWDYPAHEGIVRQVLRHRPDLLVARTTAADGGAPLSLTRTDFRLIETCPCPVLLLKTRKPYSGVVMAAALDPALAHGKPAALDREILDSAARVRDALDATLWIFHARTHHERTSRSVLPGQTDSPLLGLAERYDVPRERVHVAEGHPAEALPDLARRHGVNILVLGAAARSALRRALLGHTAERILDSLACDVLIVKTRGFRSAIGRQSTHHVPKMPDAGTLRAS